MKRHPDLSIGQRLAFGFGVACACLALIIAGSRYGAGQVRAARHRLNDVIAPRAEAADRLERKVLYMGLAARAYLAIPGPERLQAYEEAAREVREEVERFALLPKDPEGLKVFAPVPVLAVRFEQAGKALVYAGKEQPDLAALELQMAREREDLLSAVRDYAALQRVKVAQARVSIDEAVERMSRTAAGLGGLALLLLAAAAALTARSVRRPALALVDASRRLAAGDYAPATAMASGAQDGQPRRRDELAELSQSFGRMALDLQVREERLRAGARLSTALAQSLEAGLLCDSGLQIAAEHVGAEAGALYLLGEDGKLRRRSSLGLPKNDEALSVGEGVPGRAAATRKTVLVSDLPADSPFAIRLGIDQLPPRAVVAVPLVLQERHVVGVLLLASVRAISPEAVLFLESSATQLAVSLQNALVHAQVQQLATELQQKSERLQAQNEEIQAQQEELQAQHEEIQAQNEELQSQNEELQAQGEELQSQGEELRKTVERLTVSEERYHGLFNHLSEGFALHELVFDADGRAVDYRFLVANPAFEVATGLKLDDAIGHTVKELLPGLEGSWIDRYAEVARTGAPARFQSYAAPLGKHFQVIAFRAGPQQFATLFMDVTDQKRAEDALRDADRNKNEFLAVLSHELRNPLSPIKNSLFVLDRADPQSEQARRAKAVIDRQVAHLTRLVEDLLDITRISRGKVQLRKTSVELGALVRQAAEDHASEFAERGVELGVEVAGEARVEGDSARLSQVVGNLLQNAAKFTPRGGRVRLSMEARGGRVCIRVRDTGAGMDANTVERLFRPFMQADLTLARTNGGLGLGLALVKGLVEMHGGEVRASSEGRGKGSEFVVELPVAGNLEAPAPPRHAAPPAPKRILVVEDNVDGADSLREVLELYGHQVQVAYKGAEGIALARTWRPDVLLCDIGLPDIDGHAVARAFRADPKLRSVYLVALSGYALPEDRVRAVEAGFDEHMAKPPSLEALSEALTRAPGGEAEASAAG